MKHIYKVGDAATKVSYTDRDAGTIQWVSKSGKRVGWRPCKATLLNGVASGHPQELTFRQGGFCGTTEGEQIWKLEDDPTAKIIEFSLRKDGVWRESKRLAPLVPGHSHYYDFNF